LTHSQCYGGNITFRDFCFVFDVLNLECCRSQVYKLMFCTFLSSNINLFRTFLKCVVILPRTGGSSDVVARVTSALLKLLVMVRYDIRRFLTRNIKLSYLLYSLSLLI